MSSRTYAYGDASKGEQNEYQFGASAGPTWRAIIGDLGMNDESMNEFRTSTLTTTKTSFFGFEIELFARLNQFRPFVRVTYFKNPNGSPVRGFSGTQAVFGVDVLSAIFRKQLD